ncbi:porin PorA family protein [Streptomyces specialis]|uniref:porin PorA family protein n=1 Tax=Streptomyces specialis TaxID=498367 RepID=UPI00073EBADC|nr:porin PorA family protein [Streptomyces specialis]
MRKSTWILGGLAVLLLAAAAVTRLAVYPAVHRVPSDLDVTLQYTGKATLLDALALESGDLANAVKRDVPVTVDRHVRVVDTSGDTAVFADRQTLHGPDHETLADIKHRWALDRRDLDARPAPEGSGAEPHRGLVIGWPLDPGKRDYRWWDFATSTEVDAVYDGTETVADRTAYRYRIRAEGPLTDPDLSAALPPALPKEAVSGIAATMPAGQRPDTAALAGLPDTVPLTYAATTDLRVWGDSETGSVLDTAQRRVFTARTTEEAGGGTLFPVSDVDVRVTDDSVRDRADYADSAARSLWLVGTLLPLALLVAAALIAALAIWRARRAGRRSEDAPGTA